jgi:hypothetical protein
MRIDREIAPPLGKLRPVKSKDSPGFPVHPGLCDTLANAVEHPDGTVASVLSVLTGYAYSDTGTVPVMMSRLGLEQSHCLKVTEDVDAMFIKSTAFLVQSADGRVVLLGYRGTEPANIVNWLTVLDVVPERVAFFRSPLCTVHAGFYRNVRATRYELAEALKLALNQRSILGGNQVMDRPLEALYIAGHSLGGAMAALMGVTMVTDADYRRRFAGKLRAVYTYGQPMIGNSEFARRCGELPFLRENVFRYVYRNDIVPHLPPSEAGDFQHFGQEMRFDSRLGEWHRTSDPIRQARNAAALLSLPMEFVARLHRRLRAVPFPYSAADHYPHNYVAALSRPGRPTEFGDLPYSSTLNGSLVPETLLDHLDQAGDHALRRGAVVRDGPAGDDGVDDGRAAR